MKFKVGDIITEKTEDSYVGKIIDVSNDDYLVRILRTGNRAYNGPTEYKAGTEAYFYARVTEKYWIKTAYFNYNKYWAELNES